MLAGLLFATADASDRHDTLAATLPIGGVTLIEFQARLLIACDAAQIVVVVQRLTPELVGAIARIGKRGVAVDTVRTAAEAEAKLHPLARVVMLADGLVTTGSIVLRSAWKMKAPPRNGWWINSISRSRAATWQFWRRRFPHGGPMTWSAFNH